MKPWSKSIRDGLVPGMLAGGISAVLLAWRGHAELRRPIAPLNSPSQWLWGEKALRRDHASWRYTAVGVVIHQVAAVFWGVLYQKLVSRTRATPAQDARDAVLATTAAAAVDFLVTPRRFTPGFERRLSVTSLVLIYGGFAAGVAIGSRLMRERNCER